MNAKGGDSSILGCAIGEFMDIRRSRIRTSEKQRQPNRYDGQL
jgi:hypothetical protein